MRTYYLITGYLFGVVTLAHFLRIINHWIIAVGPWSVPQAASWIGLAFSGALAVWAFRLSRLHK